MDGHFVYERRIPTWKNDQPGPVLDLQIACRIIGLEHAIDLMLDVHDVTVAARNAIIGGIDTCPYRACSHRIHSEIRTSASRPDLHEVNVLLLAKEQGQLLDVLTESHRRDGVRAPLVHREDIAGWIVVALHTDTVWMLNDGTAMADWPRWTLVYRPFF